MKKLHEILTILLKNTSDNGEDYDVAAHHDTILIQGPKPESLSKEDAAKLAELYCSFDDEEDCWKFFT